MPRRRRRRKNNYPQYFILFLMGLVLFGSMLTGIQEFLSEHLRSLLWSLLYIIILITGIVFITKIITKYFERKRQEIYFRYMRTVSHFLSMDGFEFEKYMGSVFVEMGYKSVKITPERGDHGLDITMEKDGEKYAVQVKRYAPKRTIPEKDIRDFYGSHVDTMECGIFVTTSDFTKAAREWAKGRRLILINGVELSQMRKHTAA